MPPAPFRVRVDTGVVVVGVGLVVVVGVGVGVGLDVTDGVGVVEVEGGVKLVVVVDVAPPEQPVATIAIRTKADAIKINNLDFFI